MNMGLAKEIMGFLNRDIFKLFRAEYLFEIVFIERDDMNRGHYEGRRINKKTGEIIPYETFPPRALAVCLGDRKPCY